MTSRRPLGAIATSCADVKLRANTAAADFDVECVIERSRPLNMRPSEPGAVRTRQFSETTGGGANPGVFATVDARFIVFVPTGRAYNPYTHTNWDGVRVKPEVQAPAADALIKAYSMALKNSTNKAARLPEERADGLKDPAGVLKQIFPQQ